MHYILVHLSVNGIELSQFSFFSWRRHIIGYFRDDIFAGLLQMTISTVSNHWSTR